MDWKIEFVMRPPDGPEDPAGWALVAELRDPQSPNSGVDHAVIVQSGFARPEDGMESLVEAISTAIPDVTPYDDGLLKLSELATAQEEVADAIGVLNGRLQTAEAMLDGMVGAQPQPAVNRLLAGRQVAQGPPQTPAAPARPAIRRTVMTKDLPEERQDLGGRVHGQPFGGPSRRGGGGQ